MGDKTTTGSTVVSLVHGLAGGMAPGSGAMRPQLLFTSINPNDAVTSITGSDIAFSTSDQEFYIGDITLGPGGSEWTLMKT